MSHAPLTRGTVQVGKNYHCSANYFETGLGQMVALAIAGTPQRCRELLKEKLHPFFHDSITSPLEGLPVTEYLPPAIIKLAELYPGTLEHIQHTHYNLG